MAKEEDIVESQDPQYIEFKSEIKAYEDDEEDDKKEYLEYCEKLSQKRLESGQARALLEGLKNIKCERLKQKLLKSR